MNVSGLVINDHIKKLRLRIQNNPIGWRPSCPAEQVMRKKPLPYRRKRSAKKSPSLSLRTFVRNAASLLRGRTISESICVHTRVNVHFIVRIVTNLSLKNGFKSNTSASYMQTSARFSASNAINHLRIDQI